MQVVLIDDNDAELRFLENRLYALYDDAPWELVLFTNGARAVEHIRRHFGERMLVISDERMAHLNGSDVHRALHEQGLLENVQFVLLSGHPVSAFPSQVGVERYTKPSDLDGTDEMLRGIMDAWLPTHAT